MLKVYTADLHIHTCLSPCGDLEMAPRNIVQRAVEVGLDVIAITDHNSAKNVPAVIDAAVGAPLTVVPGMEVQTREEVHVLTLFGDLGSLRQWQDRVERGLPDVANKPDYFGDQPIVTAAGEIIGFEPKLLLASVAMTVEEVFRIVAGLGGYSIPAHVDRMSFSIIGQLGFIPPSLPIRVVEVFDLAKLHNLPSIQELHVITASDAHFLADIGGKTTRLLLGGATFDEIVMALEGSEGRKILCPGQPLVRSGAKVHETDDGRAQSC